MQYLKWPEDNPVKPFEFTDFLNLNGFSKSYEFSEQNLQILEEIKRTEIMEITV